MRPWRVSVVVFIALILSACGKDSAKNPIWQKPTTQTISCEDYFSEITPRGVLNNNVWNKHAAKSFPWKQCLEKHSSLDWYGWSWSWPDTGNTIFAYPQIKIGTSPWAPTPKFNPDFPLENVAVGSLIVRHELEVQGSSEHNVATSFWLTNTNNIGEKPSPSTIIAELMIWSYATENHMNPAGSRIGNLEVENNIWEVWVEKNWSDASGANNNKWVYITFRAKNHNLNTKFDVKKFLNYAVEREILPTNFYIADVELGMEIMSGYGLAWVKEFDVRVLP